MSTIPHQRGTKSVKARHWTKEEYYRLGELGFFHGQRVELIEGKLMVLSPQGPIHSPVVDGVAQTLRAIFTGGFWVRAQFPLDLGQATEPEPDVSVVTGTREQYRQAQAHPTTALLIVEVSDSTLAYDRNRKASLYARAGIQDYWIVNLVHNQVEVYRDPIPDVSQPFGYRYSTCTVHVAGETISPLAQPQATIAVTDLMS